MFKPGDKAVFIGRGVFEVEYCKFGDVVEIVGVSNLFVDDYEITNFKIQPRYKSIARDSKLLISLEIYNSPLYKVMSEN